MIILRLTLNSLKLKALHKHTDKLKSIFLLSFTLNFYKSRAIALRYRYAVFGIKRLGGERKIEVKRLSLDVHPCDMRSSTIEAFL